jgi:hypothetical protein
MLVKIDKQQVIDLLMQQGDQGTATQAESELPDQVDTEKDRGLLEKFGIDVGNLIRGGGGGGLGGLLQ